MSNIKFPKFGNKFQCYEAEIENMQKVGVHTSLIEVINTYRLKSIKLFKRLEEEIANGSRSTVSILTPYTNAELVYHNLSSKINNVYDVLQQLLVNYEDSDAIEMFATDISKRCDKIAHKNTSAGEKIDTAKAASDLNIAFVENLLYLEKKKEIDAIANFSDELILNSIKYPFTAKWEQSRIGQLEDTKKKQLYKISSKTADLERLVESEQVFILQLESLEYQIKKYDKAITEQMRLYNFKMEEMDYQTTLRKTALNEVKLQMENAQKTYKLRIQWFEWLRLDRAATKIQQWWRPIYQRLKKKAKGKKKVVAEDEDDMEY